MGILSVGIDTGGTFTDLVAVDASSGRYHYYKVPTLTADPAKGILDGVAELLDQNGLKRGDVKFLVLGTTLATNAVLEGKWARTGLITTRGFRDVLELARQRRPHYFNLDIPKPMPPAPRDCRIEVEGRIAADGAEVTPLSEDEIARAIRELKAKHVDAVAVCYLHAYANPEHEERTRALVKELWPEVYLCTSNDVLAEFREFERFATATVNASLMPIMDRYLERFEQGVADLGIRHAPRVMQSNGGAVSPGAVRKVPVNTFFSGPAGGVIGSVGLGNQLGLPNLITFDMGGTSTDVCLIRDGEPAKKSERAMGGFPVRTRTLDIHTIGAGGGSIAWTDAGGLLKVGPQSAGAYPGPAAYGRGGTQATVTDANVVLGRLNPKTLLGGRMAMHADKAEAVIDELAAKLKVDRTKAAAGVIEIINVNMMGAVRVISVEQGEDPRDFTLVAFGGAGPLHAADVARAMGMRKVLVPPRPGLLSAIGLLHAEVRGDFSLTRLVRAEASGLKSLNEGFATLGERGAQWLKGEGEERGTYQWFADLRYFGQNFELIMELKSDKLDARTLDRLREAFHHRHKDYYGYDMRAQPVEIVNLRLVVTGKRKPTPAERAKLARGDLKSALLEKRKVWFPETGYVTTPVYDRDRLPADARITGPAIVEQMDTTTVVPPKAKLKQDRYGYLHMELETATSKPVRRAGALAA
ncbi:MAG TPA: hydantoinase/oxoprolinase family protein [Burkholderiales bacterium]|nr:hydantoinase/oxoprolinase family protein [Burkholderiales bacterium]